MSKSSLMSAASSVSAAAKTRQSVRCIRILSTLSESIFDSPQRMMTPQARRKWEQSIVTTEKVLYFQQPRGFRVSLGMLNRLAKYVPAIDAQEISVPHIR